MKCSQKEKEKHFEFETHCKIYSLLSVRNITIEITDMHYCCHSLVTEAELERLKHALKLLSEAEKQLRLSSERCTWFTAALLQLGSMHSPDLTQSGSSRRQSSRTTEEDPSSTSREAVVYKRMSGPQYMPQNAASPASLREPVNGNSRHLGEVLSRIDGHNSYSKPSHSRLKDAGALAVSQNGNIVGNTIITCRNSEKLGEIWAQCIERCHSKTLKQLLQVHGKLLSISEVESKSNKFYWEIELHNVKEYIHRHNMYILNRYYCYLILNPIN